MNATSGASDLSMDPTNPRILFATFWDHQRLPWQVRSGGPGSGIWKSTDGGDTWTRLTEGLPKLMGKVGVAVSPANPDRVFAIVEAEKGGLYRSDDAGKTWRLLSEDRNIQARPWYYMNVIADPANADVVYVMNAPILKSIDGGRTFATLPAPHGDNHALWINPKDSRYIANANDGGGTISVDGAKSWSTIDNQPTAQFYHVIVDDAYPYRLYSGQQDNSSVIIKSRSDGPNIGASDWQNGPGCESANIGVDRKNPRYTYGGCYQGIFQEMDMQTGLTRRDHGVAGARAHGADERDQVSVQLDGAGRRVAARLARDLPRRQRPLPHGRSRQDVGTDLAGPDAQRQGDAGLGRHADLERGRGRRGVWHHRHDRRVAA